MTSLQTNKTSDPTLGSFLKFYLRRKQDGNRKYSLRAFARDLKLSPSFVSLLLADKKALALERVPEVAKALELDISSTSALKELAYLKKINLPEAHEWIALRKRAPRGSLAKHRPMHRKTAGVLTKWWNLAILDLSTCDGFDSNPATIAKRLGLDEAAVASSMQSLVIAGLATFENGVFAKTQRQVRWEFPATGNEVRSFHSQMLEKARRILQTQTTPEHFERRLITGITAALNPAQLDQVKALVSKLMYEAAETATEGKCSEVYHIAVQVMPLTTPRSHL